MTDKQKGYLGNQNLKEAGINIEFTKEQVKEYKRRQSQGCCGSEDNEIEIKGVKYRIGFNYGH